MKDLILNILLIIDFIVVIVTTWLSMWLEVIYWSYDLPDEWILIPIISLISIFILMGLIYYRCKSEDKPKVRYKK